MNISFSLIYLGFRRTATCKVINSFIHEVKRLISQLGNIIPDAFC